MILPTFFEALSTAVSNTNITEGAEAAIMSSRSGSLTRAGAATRVEPMLVIDDALLNYEYNDDMAKFMLLDFSAYYLNAANMLSTISGVNVSNILGQLNPNRSVDMLDFGVRPTVIADSPSFILEAHKFKYALPFKAGVNHSFESKSLTEDMEKGSLAIGRMVRVEFNVDEVKHCYEIAIRLRPRFANSYVMSAIIAIEDIQDHSLKGRFDKLQAGEIGYYDFITCRDMNERKRVLTVKDKDGLYKEITKRKNNNTLMALLTGKRSYAYQSNLMIIDKGTMRDAERRLHGSFDSERVRNAVFENSALMTIMIVDREYDQMTVYHAGIPSKLVLTAKQLKVGTKSETESIKDMLAAFINNKPAAF